MSSASATSPSPPIVDGNPPRYRAYPSELAVAVPGADGPLAYDVADAADWDGGPPPGRRVFTSTNTNLAQSMVYLDSFQAFDRETRQPGDEELAVELYRLLINRHEGGAFDVLRQYANLSALQRVLLGWRDGEQWIESQGGGFVVVNENMSNLVPAVRGRRRRRRALRRLRRPPSRRAPPRDDRTSIVHAANDDMARALLAIVDQARRRVRERREHAPAGSTQSARPRQVVGCWNMDQQQPTTRPETRPGCARVRRQRLGLGLRLGIDPKDRAKRAPSLARA